MGDFVSDLPSFSLGFDLDLQSEPNSDPRPDPLVHSQAGHTPIAHRIRTTEKEDEGNGDVCKSPFRVSNSPPRAFKRLKRGPNIDAHELGKDADDDDEIEGFSEDEDWHLGNLATNSLCSSSKSSLRQQSVLTSKSSTELKRSKGKETENASATSVNVRKCGGDILFPRLTISPLRRFQLIDSDSDDPSPSIDMNEDRPNIIFSKGKESCSSKHTGFIDLETNRSSSGKCKNRDLWEDFHSDKKSKIPTPAFDEILEEYFTNAKCVGKAEVSNKDLKEANDDMDSFPPSHKYYFHEDSRIQKLVRDRLPHFFPLGSGNNQEHKQQSASVIDYMDQFGDGNSASKTDQKHIPKNKSRSKKGNKNSQSERMLQDSDNWVNPKACSELPKNAGNRRVQAVGKSSGHWYTNSDGRRVYVNKNGQELSGQNAYRSYKKESGIGFKNTKKKTTENKASARKKSARSRKKN